MISHNYNIASNQITNDTFLSTVFDQDAPQAHVTVFHDDPANLSGSSRIAWAGGNYSRLSSRFNQGGNQYFCISTFSIAEDGKQRRRKALFQKAHVIVVDDVGHGPSAKVSPEDTRLLRPTYRLETSPGNEQWGYVLTTPETKRERVDNLLDGMVAAGLCPDGSDPGMKGVTRYVRLPGGTNNKAKYVQALGAPFNCSMNAWEPLLTYSMEQLAASFGIDLDAKRHETSAMNVDDEDHPGLRAFSQHFHIKHKHLDKPGAYEVTCPNVAEHTDMLDDGAAIFAFDDGNLGFECFHGNCEGKAGPWLMNTLRAKDPTLSERIAMHGSTLINPDQYFSAPDQAPALPLPDFITGGEPQQELLQAPQSPLNGKCMDLDRSSDFNQDIMPLLMIIAALPRETERDSFLMTIADNTGRRVASLRTDVKTIIKEAKRADVASGKTPAWVHLSENDMPLSTIENFHALLAFYNIRDRYNEMTKSLEIDIPGEVFHTDTAKNAQILRMESLMIQYNMNPRQAVGWCNYSAQNDTYHPFREYLDAGGVWDGYDRVQMLCDTLIGDPEKSALRNILLKRWLVSVVAAALRDTELNPFTKEESSPAPRGVFTLQGEQYMGKTRWFRMITPKTMFKEGLQLGPDKDTIKQATNCLVVEIGEADVSTRQDAGRVKAFLSRDYDELRVPWDKAESRWPRRTVFGGTVNPSDFLTDTTGNSRWWVAPISAIDFDLLKQIDIMQLWLQVEQLWENSEPYLLTNLEMDMLNEHNKDSQESSAFEEFLLDEYCFDTMEGADDRNNWLTTTELSTRCKDLGVRGLGSPRKVRDTLTRLTKHTNILRSVSGVKGRLWRLPARRSTPGSKK